VAVAAVASTGPYATLHLAPDIEPNHASTPPLSFLQAGCPSCRPTNSIKALKASLRWMKLVSNFFSGEDQCFDSVGWMKRSTTNL